MAAAVVAAGAGNTCRADDVQCAACHAEQAAQLAQSTHQSLNCRECHGGNATYPLSAAELGPYLRSRQAAGLTFDHGPAFTGKPTRAEVPVACGECHADVRRMNPYGLRTDQLARYWTSGHGTTLKEKGDDRVAVCIDCHGTHDILAGREPDSRTNPFHVPDTCAACHGDAALMGEFDLPIEVVDEYRQSVHGVLLLQQGDSGAPTCATCHGNHSAIPPGFATVGAVCGQCHQHAAAMFATSIHATQLEHKGCVQCHGGGGDRHYHLIERITKPPGIMIQRYAHLLTTNVSPTDQQVSDTIHPDARAIINRALPTCLECHDELEEDESLPKLFGLLEEIAKAERYYVRTANRVDEVGKGVLLVDRQRFLFEDATTHLIALAPKQHTLDNAVVAEEVTALNDVCDRVNAELDALQDGLALRYRALAPIWVFAIGFAVVLYAKYKQLKRDWVKPLSGTMKRDDR